MKTNGMVVAFMCLLFAGCSSGVDGWQIKKAVDFCSERGGIDNMPVTFGARVVCLDGTMHEINIGR